MPPSEFRGILIEVLDSFFWEPLVGSAYVSMLQHSLIAIPQGSYYNIFLFGIPRNSYCMSPYSLIGIPTDPCSSISLFGIPREAPTWAKMASTMASRWPQDLSNEGP